MDTYRLLYLQGRFIRALETCDDPIFSKMLKKIHHTQNPITEILNYPQNLKITQAIVEEAIDTFGKPRTSVLSLSDAYYIFAKCPDKPQETKQYVELLLNNIHNSPLLLSEILETPPKIHPLLHSLDTIPNNAKKLLLKDFDPHNIQTPLDTIKLEFLTTEAFNMSNQKYKNTYDIPLKIMESILINNKHNLTASIELAIWSCDGYSTYYDSRTAAIILYENLTKHTVIPLARLILNTPFECIQDEVVTALLETLEVPEILLKFQVKGRYKPPQLLTIANNSPHIIIIYVRKTHDIEERTTLHKNQRKIYKNLRDDNISHVQLEIFYSGNSIFKHSYADPNSYIAIFTRNKALVVEIYYESDLGIKFEPPTSEMMRNVGDHLLQSYNRQKLKRPTMTMDGFIEMIKNNMNCIGEKIQDYDTFFPRLNILMRQSKWEAAITAITGITL